MGILVVCVGMVLIGDSVFCWCEGVGYERWYVQVGGANVLSGEPVVGGGRFGGSVGWMWMFGVRKWLSV